MSRRYQEELMRLQEELLAAEEEEYEEYEDEYEDEEYGDAEEDWEEAPLRPGHASRYGRGSPRRFEDRDFFEDDVDDSELLYKKDYKKAKRKKARKKFGLLLLAILELAGLGALLLWWASWTS